MKHKRFFRILAVAVILSLLMLAIPFTSAQAALILTPNQGGPGTEFTITGQVTGSSYFGTVYAFFTQGSTDHYLGTCELAHTTGVLSGCTFTVPAGAIVGPAIISLREGQLVSTPQVGTLLVFTVVTAQIAVSPTSGYVGETTVTVTGSGFLTGQTMTIYFDAAVIADTTPATITTGTTGAFTATFVVPASARGAHTVKAQGSLAESATAAFTTLPKIVVTPTSGGFGDTVTVTGTGFAASSTMTIYFDTPAVATTPAAVTSDPYGGFTADINVPDVSIGAHTVKAQDAGAASAEAAFTVSTSVAISPVTSASSPGNVGDEVTITGSGFIASSTITITYASTPVTFTITSLADGSFSYTFEVPPSIAGAHTITVTDGTTSVTTTFYMESDPPAIPQPQLPYMLDKTGSQASFDWDSSSDDSAPVTYELQVAADENFTAPLLVAQTGLTLSEYTLTEAEALESTSEEEPYYWRVRAVDAASNASAWSPVGTFYVGFSFAITGWVLYLLIGIGVVLVFILGFWLGRRSTPGEDYYYEA
ncbi:MAG TPA: hypothetical protein G4N91_01140 [Dehalococcoidia bacterium]|nr:hypothetical protein [Dehalococcoidia bacterium]